MEIKLNKDIRDFQSKNSLNITFRQMMIGGAGIALAVFAAIKLHRYIPIGVVVVLVMIPFALAGDFGPKIQGMPFREYLWLWLRFVFFEPHALKFVGNNFWRKEVDSFSNEMENPMQTDSNIEKGSESIETESTPTAKKRTLSRSKICTGNHSGAEDLEGRHFSKRKHVQ